MMNFAPGDAFAFKVNAHRHSWNGSICSNPAQWTCGANPVFREDFCAQGSRRCFHINLFNLTEPKFVLNEPDVVKMVTNDPHFFDNHLAFFWGDELSLATGQKREGVSVVYGVYRIESASIDGRLLTLHAHSDAWAVFPRSAIRRPFLRKTFDKVPYLQTLSGSAIRDLMEEAVKESDQVPADARLDATQLKRLGYMRKHLTGWLDDSAKIMRERYLPSQGDSSLANGMKAALAKGNIVFQVARDVTSPEAVAVAISRPLETPDVASAFTAGAAASSEDSDVPAAGAPAPDARDPVGGIAVEKTSGPAVPEWTRPVLPEAPMRQAIEAVYGESVLRSLTIASITKSLLLLTGLTGVGKSRLASMLLDDSERARTQIVPVPATWRGEADLLGWVNPVSGQFEATPFTRFLRRAEEAWDAGDRRPWLIIFEEFNLSQPEHWMAEILARLEYDASDRRARTLELGGSQIAGESIDGPPRIYLPPSLFMVGTMNNDHTVRPLSPRVLDRACVVRIVATGADALRRVQMECPEQVTSLIDELNELLEPRAVSFSARSAKSLARAVEVTGADQLLSVLDHVLVQEVLSKVRLMAGAPRDSMLLQKLKSWADQPACAELALVRYRLAEWSADLDAGRDVIQA